MKKLWFTLPIFTVLSTTAIASPYIELGYGFGTLNNNESVIFTNSNNGSLNTKLTPKDLDNLWAINLGYKLAPNYAVELGYQNFTADASKDVITQFPTMANPVEIQNEWDAKLKGNRINLVGKYLIDYNDKLQFNFGAGLMVTKYDITGYTNVQEDNQFTDVEINKGPIPGVTSPAKKSSTKFGGLVSVGANYNIWNNVTIGASANYNLDGLTSGAQLFGTVGYKF